MGPSLKASRPTYAKDIGIGDAVFLVDGNGAAAGAVTAKYLVPAKGCTTHTQRCRSNVASTSDPTIYLQEWNHQKYKVQEAESPNMPTAQYLTVPRDWHTDFGARGIYEVDRRGNLSRDP